MLDSYGLLEVSIHRHRPGQHERAECITSGPNSPEPRAHCRPGIACVESCDECRRHVSRSEQTENDLVPGLGARTDPAPPAQNLRISAPDIQAAKALPSRQQPDVSPSPDPVKAPGNPKEDPDKDDDDDNARQDSRQRTSFQSGIATCYVRLLHPPRTFNCARTLLDRFSR